ncbi:MAG: DUF4157 domain-containing protein [Bacteroidota bacterium]
MKQSITRRVRRRSTSRETNIAKKENQQQTFFGQQAHETFFQPNVSIQRKCEKCEEEDKQVKRMPEKKDEEKLHKKSDLPGEKEKKEEEKIVQKKEAAVSTSLTQSTTPAFNTSKYISTISHSGTALPASLQMFYGHRMQHDFSDVQIHTGTAAEQSAKSVQAQAYTYGNHIVFANGKYQPDTDAGKTLLAHELVHVMQQDKQDISAGVQRKTDEVEDPVLQQQPLPPIRLEVEGSQIQNTTHNADCNGVSVSGNTTANYTSTGALSGRPTVATECSGCTGNDCVTVNSTVVSTFNTAPVVSLPSVPGGLNACEQAAARAFINGTLRQHEQQHVSAFNTYRGTIRTPFTFTGCTADLQAEVQSVHDNIEMPRRDASDALSAALDANGANVFNITCECPDPEPAPGK